MKKILITIAFINLWKEYTKPLLENLKNIVLPNTQHDIKVILINNGSTNFISQNDDKAYSFFDSIVQFNENKGAQFVWNLGINEGFRQKFDYTLTLNNDVLLHKASINKLVERFEKGGVGMVTCMNMRGQVKKPEDIYLLKTEDYEKTDESESPDFSAFMSDKKAWETVGEFDTGFYPAYFEDNDYHYRMKLLGIKAINFPQALYYHYGSRTLNEVLEKRPGVPSLLFIKNQQYYTLKWGGLPGQEKYKHPFNNIRNSVKWTKQNPK